MTARSLLLLSIFALPLSIPAHGQPGDAGVRVEGAWSRSAPVMGGAGKSGSGNGAVYATLVNPGRTPDVLVAATSDSAGATEIHETYQDMGMMMMRPVKKIDVPAGGKVDLKPGGYHIMLLNLKRALKAGEVVNVTLQFQKSGKVEVKATVK